jgi:cytochrome oxidase Cu insertion factor (SCO1/SenC/PrrC family)
MHAETAQCKILTKPGRRNALHPARDVDFFGDIGMKVNDKAPDFVLQDENGEQIALKDLRGKTVILFFYPRANTPG